MPETGSLLFYLLPLVSAVLLTLLLMPSVVRIAQRVGAVDHPNHRKVHQQITPRMGGVAFLLSLLFIPFTLLDVSQTSQGFLLGLLIVGVTGIADDILEISSRLKFAGVIFGSLVFLLMSGTSIQSMGDLFASGVVELGVLAIPFTLIAMVGTVNAINLSDGLDGLAAGITLITSFCLACFALLINDQFGLILAIVLFGSMLGFLYFNSYPAKVFMGDTGSLILGYTLAALSLLLIKSGEGLLLSPMNMGILLGLPLVDTLYVMLKRLLSGKNPFLADKTHFHHRLIDLGLSHSSAVSVFYLLMFIYGGIAVLVIGSDEWLKLLVLLSLVGMTYLTLFCLEYFNIALRLPASNASQDSATGANFNAMKKWLGQTTPVVTWLIPILLAVPVFTLSMSGAWPIVMVAVMVLVILLYPWRQNHDESWSHGLLYLLVFILVFAMNTASTAWVQSYMMLVTALLAGWIVLKLCFKQHLRIFLSTGLECLLLAFSWFIPWLAGHLELISSEFQTLLLIVCLQSIVFLLATKIVLRRQPRRNRGLLIALLLLTGACIV